MDGRKERAHGEEKGEDSMKKTGVNKIEGGEN